MSSLGYKAVFHLRILIPTALTLSLIACFWPLLDVSSYWAELVGHSRLQITVIIGLVSLLFLALKRYPAFVLQAMIALVSGYVVVSSTNSRSCDNGNWDFQSGFRVMSFNALVHNEQLDPLLNALVRLRPDLLFLVEVNPAMFHQAKQRVIGEYPFSTSVYSPRTGTAYALLSRWPFLTSGKRYNAGQSNFPLFQYDIQLETQALTLFGVHTTSPRSAEDKRTRDGQLRDLLEVVSDNQVTNPKVLMGDFNATPWTPALRNLAKQLNYFAPSSSLQGTWPTWLPKPLRVPIDHIFYDDRLCTLKSGRIDIQGSDHAAVYADLGFGQAR